MCLLYSKNARKTAGPVDEAARAAAQAAIEAHCKTLEALKSPTAQRKGQAVHQTELGDFGGPLVAPPVVSFLQQALYAAENCVQVWLISLKACRSDNTQRFAAYGKTSYTTQLVQIVRTIPGAFRWFQSNPVVGHGTDLTNPWFERLLWYSMVVQIVRTIPGCFRCPASENISHGFVLTICMV